MVRGGARNPTRPKVQEDGVGLPVGPQTSRRRLGPGTYSSRRLGLGPGNGRLETIEVLSCETPRLKVTLNFPLSVVSREIGDKLMFHREIYKLLRKRRFILWDPKELIRSIKF